MNRIKTLIPRSIRSSIGRVVRNARRRPLDGFGLDFVFELKTRLPKLQIDTIFDVGAHIGVTALEFSDAFPKARVYAFEPSLSNFERMKQNLIGKPDVQCFRFGMADQPNFATLFMDPRHPSMARISNAGCNGGTETVELDTIDRFCGTRKIVNIDVLKIDTEGHELQVLVGATQMLKQANIAVIKGEVAVDPDSNYHTSFFSFTQLLEPFGYRLFGLYDQQEDVLTPGPRLRRFDVAFISPKLF